MNASRLTIAPLLLALAGCGGTYDASVTGIVSMDNAPLQRGTVSFHPLGDGPSAYGLILNDGKYTLQTGREEGLTPGSYVVTVVSNEPSVEREPGATPTPGKPITPRWYRSKDSSELKFTVQPGSNTIDLALHSEPPAGWQDPTKRQR